MWDIPSCEVMDVIDSYADNVLFSPNGYSLVSNRSGSNKINFWYAHTGQLKTELVRSEIDRNIELFGYSPDGSVLIGLNFRGIWIFDAYSLKLIGNHLVPRRAIAARSMSFSPDGSALAVPSWGGSVLVWDISPPYITRTITVVHPEPPLPVDTALQPNYPNPFNSSTQIPYRLGESGPVRLAIYNVLGQSVRTLLDEVQSAGFHQVSWDGKDSRGGNVTSGVYFLRIHTGRQQLVQKITLLR